ncbi:DoxX family protein [Vulgatibacter incomptus]|uniref:DoxX family protein n=1 Tax=Vulgatibacter incomptus TaxID=1391653 RepID=A0A0K1PJA2_9BACT|nr:DoxX family protein [Vulgatibacter incomptus]AKU93179.1 DoxX family protein [Vulgatibacter incomptus]
MAWPSSEKQRDIGLLLVRVGIGLMFILAHGLPKLMGGPAVWAKVGSATGYLGITAVPALFGLLATIAELGGGVLLIAGKWVRVASAAMLVTMLVATLMHIQGGDGLAKASHAIEAAVLFAGLTLLGGGRYGIDGRSA